MRTSRDYLAGLAQLHLLKNGEERTAAWRQSVAALVAARTAHDAAPLEDLNPHTLHASVAFALSSGLFDRMDFISPAHAAAATFEIAAALPSSHEKKELGRRVLRKMIDGDATTFVEIATTLAANTGRAITAPAIRSRITLALDLPLGSVMGVDQLSLMLATRREASRDWVIGPSSGSLAKRRLAARIFERAAAQSARQADEGDDAAAQILLREPLVSAWHRLLKDREPLVWKHVAVARGLLSQAVPALVYEIARGTDESLSPTEWRRAATSIGARFAIAPDEVAKQIREFCAGPVPKRDPGVLASIVTGLPRALEVDMGRGLEVLDSVISVPTFDILEALTDVFFEVLGAPASVEVANRVQTVAAAIEQRETSTSKKALIRSLAEQVSDTSPSLRSRMEYARLKFVEGDMASLRRIASDIASDATAHIASITKEGDVTAILPLLRDVDATVLERTLLSAALQTSGEQPKPDRALSPQGAEGVRIARDPMRDTSERSPLERALEALAHWLISEAVEPVAARATPPPASAEIVQAHQRLLRAFLHLVDRPIDEAGEARDWRPGALSALIRRARREPTGSSLRRTICAATARALDALVAEDVLDLCDVVLVLVDSLDSTGLDIVAEASMLPDLASMASSTAKLSRALGTDGAANATARTALSAAFSEVARTITYGHSPRTDALRSSLITADRALTAIVGLRSLRSVSAESETSPLHDLARAMEAIARLCRGARRRVIASDPGPATPSFVPPSISVGDTVLELAVTVDRAANAEADARGFPTATHKAAVESALKSLSEALTVALPAPFAHVAIACLSRLSALPCADARGGEGGSIALQRKAKPLPAWLPASRVIGGFQVLRTLGAGAGGSVFVVKRIDERHRADAECFALKVPEYDATASRTLSETQFMQMFRDEASALMALPQHAHLARFVTFDAGARPKPALVMEYVEGPTLDHQMRSEEVSMKDVFRYLDGIAAGLAAMHAVGVGHLDVKPSNVVLRMQSGSTRPQAVLVDFGLAGRNLRPGCATANFGAPEIWGLGDMKQATPLSADVYAFSCLAFEVLTGRTLFEAPSEMSLIAAHVSHDGVPERLGEYQGGKYGELLVRLLSPGLRRNPSERMTIQQLRAMLVRSGAELGASPWPVARA